MNLEDHRRQLFSYPSLFTRALTGGSTVTLLEDLAKFVDHLDFDNDDDVAFVRQYMPFILAGDCAGFHASPPERREGSWHQSR